MSLDEIAKINFEEEYESFDLKRFNYSRYSAYSALGGSFFLAATFDNLSLDPVLTFSNLVGAVSIAAICYSGFALYQAAKYIKACDNCLNEYGILKDQQIQKSINLVE